MNYSCGDWFIFLFVFCPITCFSIFLFFFRSSLVSIWLFIDVCVYSCAIKESQIAAVRFGVYMSPADTWAKRTRTHTEIAKHHLRELRQEERRLNNEINTTMEISNLLSGYLLDTPTLFSWFLHTTHKSLSITHFHLFFHFLFVFPFCPNWISFN